MMKGRSTAVGLVLVSGILGLGYLLAIGKPLNHELAFLVLLVGFVICDRTLGPRRSR